MKNGGAGYHYGKLSQTAEHGHIFGGNQLGQQSKNPQRCQLHHPANHQHHDVKKLMAEPAHGPELLTAFDQRHPDK